MHYFWNFYIYNIHKVGTKNLTEQNMNNDNLRLYNEPLINFKL